MSNAVIAPENIADDIQLAPVGKLVTSGSNEDALALLQEGEKLLQSSAIEKMVTAAAEISIDTLGANRNVLKILPDQIIRHIRRCEDDKKLLALFDVIEQRLKQYLSPRVFAIACGFALGCGSIILSLVIDKNDPDILLTVFGGTIIIVSFITLMALKENKSGFIRKYREIKKLGLEKEFCKKLKKIAETK
ncbi:MAG: hypothetical protein Q8R36_02430 [bacterium]|nr:hypothetical protein [bacterium]